MENMADLRPCPFCGGNAELKTYRDNLRGDTFAAMCQKTDCPGRTYRKRATLKAAIEAWNRRAEPENRVLTLEEATGSEDPVWLETRKTLRVTDVCIAADFRYAEVYTTGSRIPYLMLLDSYGQTWRCWLRKPTAEEMANMPWEE